jgi:hypothetical protein
MHRMNPLSYSLCQKPVLGLMMFVSGMCAFPPLFLEAPLPLQRAGARVIEEVEAPVGKAYFLDLVFTFPSAAAARDDEVVGSRFDDVCLRNEAGVPELRRSGLGRPIPIHVRVRDQRSGTVSIDKVFYSLCLSSSGPTGTGYTKHRTAGRLDLPAGRYLIEVRNMESQAGLEDVRTAVSLVAGQGK